MLAKLLNRTPLNGNKTWIAGVGLILFAIGGYVSGNLDGDVGIIGIGHKVEKLVEGPKAG